MKRDLGMWLQDTEPSPYQSQERLLFPRSNMKNLLILKGEPLPSNNKEIFKFIKTSFFQRKHRVFDKQDT